jgi:hypothetical protein
MKDNAEIGETGESEDMREMHVPAVENCRVEAGRSLSIESRPPNLLARFLVHKYLDALQQTIRTPTAPCVEWKIGGV